MHMFNTDGVIYDKELEEHHNKMCPYSEQELSERNHLRSTTLSLSFANTANVTKATLGSACL